MAGFDRPSVLSRPTGVSSPVGLDRSKRLAWFDVQRTDTNQRLGPATDPTNSHWIHKFNLGNEFRLFYGRIVDAVAYVNCYKVQVENGTTTLWCTALSQTALQPIGARQLGQIAIGAAVVFALHPTDNSGLILGVIPEAQTASQSAAADFVSQASRSGLLVDSAHSYPLNQRLASLITDWSAGRPMDATTQGESGTITETGLLRFVDSFMTMNRVDEECGVWHFYGDSLTRIAGKNFQLWTTGSEREDVDDEGEFDIVEGYTPYPWEALGAFEFDIPTCRDLSADCWQKDPDHQGYASQEPCHDQQTPFFRLRDFYGYLGQGHKRVLSLPPQPCNMSLFLDPAEAGGDCSSPACTADNLNLLPTELIYPGVFDENLALTGRYAVRSAHEIILSKHLLIPSPKQITLPQDPSGDNLATYKPAGIHGAGDDHLVVGEIAIEEGGTDEPGQIRAAGFLDTHAFAFNWIGEHPFHYHTRDWYIPEESALTHLDHPGCDTVSFPTPTFADLECNHFLETPVPIPLKVDHRYNEANYYPNHSYIALLAEGGIVIGDGYGAEIKLANGSVWITAPGDINTMAGRDVVNFAGYDFVAKAKNSWDISATNADGRLKAKNNLWMVANGEEGSILIESKATGAYKNDDPGEMGVSSGVAIKAGLGKLDMKAKNMTFKLIEPNAESVLTLDTGEEGRLRFRGKFFERFLSADGAALDFWGGGETSNEWWADGALINTPVVIDDSLMVAGCGVFQDDIISDTGHIATKRAAEMRGQVGKFNGSFEEKFEYFRNRHTGELPAIAAQETETMEEREEEYIIHDRDFTFRSVEEYRTETFVLFESRWQQLARLSGVTMPTWAEDPVSETYPYPGASKQLGETFRTLDLKLYDVETKVANNRGPDYEDPSFETPEQQVLNDSYTVII
jgi:hypothetical protein